MRIQIWTCHIRIQPLGRPTHVRTTPKEFPKDSFSNLLRFKADEKALPIMQKNFQHDLNLEDFAKLSGRSLSTFKRDFKDYFKETPGKWLTNKRLEFAKSLLLSSDLDINQICFESGFKNPSHFNKIFKEKYTMPPRQYRENSI